MKEAGFLFTDVVINEGQLLTYLQYGHASKANSWNNLSDTSKMEVKATAAKIRTAVAKQRFLIKTLGVPVVDELQDALSKDRSDDIVAIHLPLRLRSDLNLSAHKDRLYGPVSTLIASEVNPHSPYFLTKNQTLHKCTTDEATLVKDNGGYIYYPEADASHLIARFTRDKKRPAFLRSIYSVELVIDELELKRPSVTGFYRRDDYIANPDSEQLRKRGLMKPNALAPTFFLTSSGAIGDPVIPERPTAKLLSLKMHLQENEKVVGGLKAK